MTSGIPDANPMDGIAPPDAFSGRTAIVTGGAGKIGRAICRGLGMSGANVVVVDIDPPTVGKFVAELKDAGYKALGLGIPAQNGAEIVKKTIEEFGGVHIVANPIVAPFQWKPFEERGEEEFRNGFESDVMGPLSVLLAAWPHFKAQKYGRVVNFTSATMVGMQLVSTYTIAKGALFGVSRTLALEGKAHNITINCIAPVAVGPRPPGAVQDLVKDANTKFLEYCTPEGNVPVVLALCGENNTISGEMFYTSGYGASRAVFAASKGFGGMKTMDEAAEGLAKMGEDGLWEPKGIEEFSKFQLCYTMGEEFKRDG